MRQGKLWVCWSKPNCLPSDNVWILSFLTASDEENLIQSISEQRLISGRMIAQDVKDDALKLYTDIVARIGVTKNSNGSTLRELLKSTGGNSLWWYHPVSFKDCEADATFNHIIQILVIDRVASEKKVENIVLWGADDTIADALKTKYRVEGRNLKYKSIICYYLKAFVSRLQQFIQHIYHWYKCCHPDP